MVDDRTAATALLTAARRGDEGASGLLVPLVYDELRRLAQAHLRRERGGHTLQPTALVHEAYLKLFDRTAAWEDRGHFLAVASRAMRQILTDHARARAAAKRGSGGARVTLDPDRLDPGAAASEEEQAALLIAVDDALVRLATLDAELARVVELRFFGGLEVDEAAEALGVSPRTAARLWARAKAYLREHLRDAAGAPA
jgi:RNA polymerase sigma-70 factor (ECF subfamily)